MATGISPPKLHPTGLHPESLAAQVLDFMVEQRLGLRALAAAAEVVAAECRYSDWVGSDVKKSDLSEEGWMRLLDDLAQIMERARTAMRVYAADQNMDGLCTSFAEVVDRLNDRSLR